MFVQQVHVHCLLCDCSSDGCGQDSYMYWENWKVYNVPGKREYIFDTAEYGTTAGRSSYRQNGVVKFFCLVPPGMPREPGEVGLDELKMVPMGVVRGNGTCPTTSGVLRRRTTHRAWWRRDSADPPAGHRRFAMYWNCCCDNAVQYARVETSAK